MEVKIYREKENENLILDEQQLLEYNKLAEELGLNSSQCFENNSVPNVYICMNTAVQKQLNALCPMIVPAETYTRTTIPLEVLKVYKFAKDNNMFDGFTVWFDDISPDPLLVGWKWMDSEAKDKGYTWRKNNYLIARWGDCAIGFALGILLFKACESDNPVIVKTEQQKGSFDTVYVPQPTHIPYPVTQYKWITKKDTILVDITGIQSAVDIQEYINAKDSLERLKMYAESIKINEYNIKNEDSLLITNNHIKTKGQLLSFKQDYIIKPKEIKISSNKPLLTLLGGVEVGNTKQLDKMAVKANIYVQNQSGNMFSIGADTESMFYIGYTQKLFEIKKP